MSLGATVHTARRAASALTQRLWTQPRAGMPGGFWLALIALIANDHVLKRSALAGAVTGKLSDFAGLLVMPVMLAVLLRVRSDRGRALILGVVYASFAAIKLDARLAALAGDALTLVMRSRLWSDPTDLIALSMAPLALDLMRRALPDRRAVGAPRAAIGLGPRLAVAIAALACVATSQDGPSDVVLRPPFLINWTRTTMEVEIAHVTIPCDADGGVQSDDLGATRVVEVEPGHAVTIRETFIDEDVLDVDATCGVARLHAEGAGTIWVAWSARSAIVMGKTFYTSATESGELTWEIEPDDDPSFEYAVALGGATSEPTWVVGERLEEGREP